MSVKVQKKTMKYPCYVCKTDGKKVTQQGCRVCDGKGNYKESMYIFIVEKNGKKYAIDSDNLA